MAKPTLRSRRLAPRIQARAFAAWLASLILVFQFWVPALYGAAAQQPVSAADASYSDLVRILGAVPICASLSTEESSPDSPERHAAAHNPLQCPVCQSLHLLSGVALPIDLVIAAPLRFDASRDGAASAYAVASLAPSPFAARAPPPAA